MNLLVFHNEAAIIKKRKQYKRDKVRKRFYEINLENSTSI